MIKICGMMRQEDIEAVNRYKPDYIGFIFVPGSRRCISIRQAKVLKAQTDPAIKTVGVFANQSLEEIRAYAEEGILDLIQLHGGENRHFINKVKRELKLPVIRAVRVKRGEHILEAQECDADYLLLDTYVKGQLGGSGRTFDWSLIPELEKPYFLAGGISEENVCEAVKTGTFGIDVSSSVETDGKKDPEKIRKIITKIRSLSI
ncbi:N-(5'-phosphoribosyl)anthranilate isomerase [Clostridium sp. chh4-2]|uniref:phosphoribosylanthranilate isomerase n=1 Tax=Clostridium sp. chh4-2 TaxID=2067550 RepID=UPI000CCF854E|nr:phosphoribosylanthranilate isomerase [Clostridium sp. chh4-2]PNV63294.1 N-(5'-phosphoribosyl)anthranilate isomerase [Clostridium sp. chh4-2]